MTETTRATEGDLVALLRHRYGEQGTRYAFLPQVGNGTGGRADRFCDALAVSLWPSDGLEWHGHEVKVSRSDWLREIKDPDKADAFARYCHRWWIVTPDKGIVAPAELRPGWGLLVARGGKLSVSVGAVRQEPADPPRPMLAAIIRRVVETAPGEQEVAALKRAADQARSEHIHLESAARRDREALEKLKHSLAEFERTSGLRIDAYNGRNLGEQVAMAQRARFDHHYLQSFERLAQTVRRLAASAEDTLSAARILSEQVTEQQ